MNIIEKFKTRVSKYGFKYVFEIILRNKIYRPLDKAVFFVSKILWKNTSLKNTIIIESHNDFDSNGGAFYHYLIKNNYNQKYKIVWMLRNDKPNNLPYNVDGFNMFKPSFRKYYYICKAKFITYDHVPIEKVRSDQLVCYLTHGPVGLKAFKGKFILPEKLDYCLCPSEYLAPLLAYQYSIKFPNKKQVILGYPMHDVFYQNEVGDLRKIIFSKYRKAIIWMPTFRKPIQFDRNDSDIELPMGIPIFNDMDELVDLNNMLKEKESFLIIKIHPMQDMKTVKVKGLSNIMILDGKSVKKLGIDNYRLMKDADALISDYSSVAYDYLHLDRPIGYTLDDMEHYKVGFIIDNPSELMAGHIIYNKKQFINFIEDVINNKDPYKEERRKLFDKVFKYHDGDSCKRLTEFMGI